MSIRKTGTAATKQNEQAGFESELLIFQNNTCGSHFHAKTVRTHLADKSNAREKFIIINLFQPTLLRKQGGRILIRFFPSQMRAHLVCRRKSAVLIISCCWVNKHFLGSHFRSECAVQFVTIPRKNLTKLFTSDSQIYLCIFIKCRNIFLLIE